MRRPVGAALIYNVLCSLTGAHIGTVVAMPLSGILAEQLGWPSIFYVFGK